MQPRFELLKVRKLGDIFNASLKVPLKSIEFTYYIPQTRHRQTIMTAVLSLNLSFILNHFILSINWNYFCSGARNLCLQRSANIWWRHRRVTSRRFEGWKAAFVASLTVTTWCRTLLRNALEYCCTSLPASVQYRQVNMR